jgi:hypothetical protein
MKVYLDTCSLQRLFDNKNQIRIRLEAEAVLGILNYFEKGKIEIVNSDILLYEINRIPNLIRRVNSLKLLDGASIIIKLNKKIEEKAREFSNYKIMALDALHLACAEYAIMLWLIIFVLVMIICLGKQRN